MEDTVPNRLTSRVPRLRVVLTLLVAALAVAAVGSSARADDGLTRYAGNYAYAGTKAQGEAVVDKALDEALAQLNVVMRTLIKKAIAARPGQRFIEAIHIETPEGKIGLKMGEFEAVTLAVNKPTEMTRDGRTGTVTHKFNGGKITQELDGKDGKVINVLTLSKDGKTLNRDVTITSPRLEKPIAYRLVYKRK
jgi:hypothetical protein